MWISYKSLFSGLPLFVTLPITVLIWELLHHLNQQLFLHFHSHIFPNSAHTPLISAIMCIFLIQSPITPDQKLRSSLQLHAPAQPLRMVITALLQSSTIAVASTTFHSIPHSTSSIFHSHTQLETRAKQVPDLSKSFP